MYQVSLFNNNIETVVHYPSSNQDDPHVNKLPLKEGLSVVDSLSFSLYPNNQGYNNVFELVTKVRIFDVRDNAIRFTGRVLDISEKMDSDGKIYKEIKCEGALSYLNDTKQRGSSFYAENVTEFLIQILGVHNSKVEPTKQIQVGNVNVGGNVIHTCNFKTTLAEILEVRETTGGDIRIREVNSILYLDWLTTLSENTLEVSLGVNMKDMVVYKDVTSLGTRIVPLGANNLTIESVNGGLDYLEDVTSRNIYGVIEKTVEYKDIEDATTLFNTCAADMSKHTQPSYILESNALDLSYISGNKSEQFSIGVNIHLVNQYMGVDTIYKVVALDLELLEPYNPTLTIANKPITLTNTINDLRNSSIQNDGIYNNVQIGRSFGIRAVRSDSKVITTINATDGISIKNLDKKVFYVDIDGNLVAVDIKAIGGMFKNITSDDMTANRGTFNDIDANGGIFDDITANRGTYNDINANRGTFKDINSTNGTFDDITANRGTYNDINANRGTFKDINSTNGTFDDMTANRGNFDNIMSTDSTFEDMTVTRGTFDNIIVVNGLVIKDGDMSCFIDALGIKLVGADGGVANIQILDDSNVGVYIPDDLIVGKHFEARGPAIMGDNLTVKGTLFIGTGDNEEIDLDEVIENKIINLVKAESLK